jgi:hypothetical protein
LHKPFVAAIALLSLSACASTYVGKPYTKSAAPLTTVGLADDMLPSEVIAFQVASTMSNFGLLGAIIDAGVQASRKHRVNEALDSIGYAPEPTFEAYLRDALKDQGVTARLVAGPDREKREFLVDYPATGQDVQAYLDLVVKQYGYVQAGGNLWRPAVLADVRLVDRVSGNVLMENRIGYNIPDAPAGIITLPPNPEFAFEDREDMITNADKLAAGLDDALHEVAISAVRLLR